jgi:flagellar motility protein MotE (MotC chaperone)
MTRLLIRFLRDVRLLPIVLVAIISLFALKTLGLVLDGGYLFDNLAGQNLASQNPVSRADDDGDVTGTIAGPKAPDAPAGEAPVVAKPSWAQQMFNYPDVTGAVDAPPSPPKDAAPPGKDGPAKPDAAKPDAAKPDAGKPDAANPDAGAKKKPLEPPPSPGGTLVQLDTDHPLSPAERSILESLQKRRTELEARSHDLDMREDLVKAAEKRMEGRIAELKELEARVDTAVQQKDDAEKARFKKVVTMYETMKAKDAAKIFDGLDMSVLLDVAREVNPRNMSDILAQMQPEMAQRLTSELAARPGGKDAPQTAADLPKIVGRPTPN